MRDPALVMTQRIWCPQLRISNVAEIRTMQPADMARWIEGLRSAGLPEYPCAPSRRHRPTADDGA